jgi:hypothetical protein
MIQNGFVPSPVPPRRFPAAGAACPERTPVEFR